MEQVVCLHLQLEHITQLMVDPYMQKTQMLQIHTMLLKEPQIATINTLLELPDIMLVLVKVLVYMEAFLIIVLLA